MKRTFDIYFISGHFAMKFKDSTPDVKGSRLDVAERTVKCCKLGQKVMLTPSDSCTQKNIREKKMLLFLLFSL